MAENQSSPESKYKIPVAEGVRLTRNWRAYLEESKQEFKTRGFLISIDALRELLATNPEAEGVRAYLGLNDAKDPVSGTLILVPVVNNEDVIYLPEGSGLEDDEDDSNIYDRSTPCPPLCGVRNELNS